jgi:hypothetical protein
LQQQQPSTPGQRSTGGGQAMVVNNNANDNSVVTPLKALLPPIISLPDHLLSSLSYLSSHEVVLSRGAASDVFCSLFYLLRCFVMH